MLRPDKPRWRFVLINSKDMSRIGILSDASGRKLDLLADKPGKADWSYPMNGKYAPVIEKYKTGVLAERFNWRASLAYQAAGYKGEIWDKIWSGYVLSINEDWTNNKMTISCPGWMQRLYKRFIRVDMNWVNIDDALIIRDLLQRLNGDPAGPSYEIAAGTLSYVAGDGYTVRWPDGSVPNTSTWIKWGGTLPNEGAGGATAYTTAMRNFKYTKYQPVGPVIDQIVNIENGCDVVLDPATRALTCHRRYRRVKDNVIIGFQWGPQNAAQFGRTLDGEQEVNYFLALGDAGTTPGYKDDIARIDQVGLIEEMSQLSGVNDNAVLLAYAGAEIIVRKSGLITYGITPFGYTSDNSVPEPLVDYRVGDQIRVTAQHAQRGSIINQAVRVFGMSIGIDDSGNEQLGQLQIAP
jgi:hypothetical protein